MIEKEIVKNKFSYIENQKVHPPARKLGPLSIIQYSLTKTKPCLKEAEGWRVVEVRTEGLNRKSVTCLSFCRLPAAFQVSIVSKYTHYTLHT